MFWSTFTAGSNSGSAIRPLRPSGQLANKLNTVFVSINYRLNAFGFLALDVLANENANSSLANYGLWDIILAIEWLHKNIRSFGGHPSKITLFGPNGLLIMSLLENNEYNTLIKSAWISDINQIPAIKMNFSQQAQLFRETFLKQTNCTSGSCLKSMDSRHILNIYLSARNNINNSLIIHDGQ